MISLATAFSALTGALRGQAAPRLVATGDVSPVLAARVAEQVGRTWGVDTAGLVLSWGSGSLAGATDRTPFKLLGRGEGGWFAVTVELPGRPALAIRLRAGIAGTRLVAVRALRVGMRLAEGDMREEPYLAWGPPIEGALVPEPGWVVRRIISPGDPMDATRVSPPPIIESGQPMRLIWSEGTVSVALEGTAINDAAMGQPVRVRTGGRSGVLLGIATAPGEARMQ